MSPPASIVIPTRARPDYLEVALSSIAPQAEGAGPPTSLAGARLSHRIWRAVHWLAYVCWPLALIHGFTSGTDSSTGWARSVYSISLLAVAGAVGWRLRRSAPVRRRWDSW